MRIYESYLKDSIFSGLTSKSERAAVGEASKTWSGKLQGQNSKPIDIELGPDVYDSTAFKIKIVFENSTFKADQDVFISCYLALDSSSQTEAYEIPISRYIHCIITKNYNCKIVLFVTRFLFLFVSKYFITYILF